jgi:hypothetical protein
VNTFLENEPGEDAVLISWLNGPIGKRYAAVLSRAGLACLVTVLHAKAEKFVRMIKT